MARGDKAIDVRALVAEVEVIAAPAATRLTAALGWDDGPLLRARVGISAAGSAKPIELAKAFGVYGPDDPRARHALVARLALVGLDAAVAAAGPGDQDAIVNAAQLASASGTTVSGQTTTSA